MQRPSSGELGVGGLDVRRGLTKPRDEGTDSPVHPPQEQVCHFQKHCKKKKKKRADSCPVPARATRLDVDGEPGAAGDDHEPNASLP